MSPLRSNLFGDYSRRSKTDSNTATCVVCRLIMDKWDSTKIPIYQLIIGLKMPDPFQAAGNHTTGP